MLESTGIGGLRLVTAVVRPHLVEALLAALKFAPIEAMLVKEVKGFGRQKNMLDQYSAQDFELAFLPKVEITLWVEESRLDEVLQIVEEASRTGRMGDGKIFVVQAEEEVPPS